MPARVYPRTLVTTSYGTTGLAGATPNAASRPSVPQVAQRPQRPQPGLPVRQVPPPRSGPPRSPAGNSLTNPSTSPAAGGGLPPRGRVLYQGTEARLIHHAVGSHVIPHRLRVPGTGAVRAKLRVLHRGEIALYQMGYGAHAELRFDPQAPVYLVHLTHCGGGQLTVDGRELPLSPVVTGPGQDVVARWTPDTTGLVVRIPRRVIDAAIRPYAEDPTEDSPLRFEPLLDTANDEVRQWLHLAHSFGSMVDSGLLTRSPDTAAHFEQMLVHGLLACQSHTLSGGTLRGGPVGAPVALRRALAFCEEHASEPISVADIAAASHMSVRTLQEKFRTHLGVTPLAHLRHVRLAGAHADLLAVAEGRSDDTVTGIALRWGFSHLGRFGSLYRAAYGRLPSQTTRSGDAEVYAFPRAAG
ncbi:AraC family transcriptional regulator [Yinghuangia soli]|uniref:AraC family transcriptional regulator n=1 Tax=Yinghuangia soli TaxID=2908204 RepID=A0AA41Q823_9ACTN|nr:AraC family transcriptional regulator [Yinghuangia soli]MCF2531897.1 AraC family transcriptional regulator [Yinghuangia soli]